MHFEVHGSGRCLDKTPGSSEFFHVFSTWQRWCQSPSKGMEKVVFDIINPKSITMMLGKWSSCMWHPTIAVHNGELIYQVSQWNRLIFCCRSAKVGGIHRITVGPGHVSFVCLGMSFTAHMMLQPWWNGRMACCPPSWGGCARNLGTNLRHNQWSRRSLMKQHWNCAVNNLQSAWLRGRQTLSYSVLFVLPCLPLEYDIVAACRMKSPMRSGWCWTGQSIPCGSSPWIQCWTTTRQTSQVSFHDRIW